MLQTLHQVGLSSAYALPADGVQITTVDQPTQRGSAPRPVLVDVIKRLAGIRPTAAPTAGSDLKVKFRVEKGRRRGYIGAMARKLRLQYDGAIYHITVRGNGRRRIFVEDTNRERFLWRLAESKEQYGVRVYLYCLMDNHFIFWLKHRALILAALCRAC